jgi:hypothetical protein
MQKRIIFILLVILVEVIVTAGCTSAGSSNATTQTTTVPTPTVPSVTAYIPFTTETPNTVTSVPVSITTTPTIEQPNETTLASYLTISGTGSNYQSDSRGIESSGNYICTYSTSGTLYIYGSVDSKSRYPLKVDMEADIFNVPVTVASSTLYDSIIVPTYGTAKYQFSTPYTGGCDVGDTGTYNVSIMGVSIASSTVLSGSPTSIVTPIKTITPTPLFTSDFGSSPTIQITSTGFIPQYDIVHPGAAINWVNDDTIPHGIETIWSYPGMPNLSNIMPGGSSQYTFFEKPGIYTYVLSDNQNITGIISVG